MWRTIRRLIPPTARWDDFDELVTQAKSRGIRIILDMVFNHTSPNMLVSRGAETKSPLPPVFISGAMAKQTPPNNWRSKFGGSAWRWHAESEQYYLHLFAPEQADLNWEENPAVRAELKKSSVSSGPIVGSTGCAWMW